MIGVIHCQFISPEIANSSSTHEWYPLYAIEDNKKIVACLNVDCVKIISKTF